MAAPIIEAPIPDPASCRATFCFADALAPFFARLRASRAGDGAPIHIVQIGDSHTAGDMITSGWRTRLQARYGTGGRGILAAGRPYQGYLTWGVTATQSAGWSVNARSGSRYRADGPPIGISGFTQTAQAAGEALGLTADTPDQDFDRIIVCAVTRPGGGTIVLRMGSAEQRWPLAAPRPAPACRAMDSDAPVAGYSLATADAGIVSITSVGTFRRGGGIILSNLGVVGAQLPQLERADDAVVRAELAAYRPDLIILAFGTNEGFAPALDLDAYEAALRDQVARIRRLAGGAVPILLLGAPDAAARQALRADGEGDCGDGWSVPRLLGEVRLRQQATARALGLGFWNWAAAMGGRCASSSWVAAGLMRADHVHFTRSGGDRIAAMIDADIMGALNSMPVPDHPAAEEN